MPVAVAADRRFRRAHVRPARRRHAWTRLVPLVRTVVALACLAGGGYLLEQQVAHARVLRIDRIAVRGNERLSTGEVLVLLEGLRGQHVLAVRLDEWQRRVLSSPWVGYATLRRVLPSTVEVAIRERQPMAIGRLGRDLYLVDAEGRVIDEYGPSYAQFDLPIVDGLGGAPSGGEPAVDEDRVELARRLLAAVGRAPALLRRVSQIDVSNTRDAVVLLAGDTTRVHLGDDQFAGRLQSYVDLASALHQRVGPMEYVDVRFDSHIYVRPAAEGSKKRR
jgi:cell division septal protein FtsQ